MEDFEVFPRDSRRKLEQVLDLLELTCHWAPDPRMVKARDALREVLNRTCASGSPSAAA